MNWRPPASYDAGTPSDAKGQDLVPQWEADYRTYIADRRAFTADLRDSGENLPFYETQVSGIPITRHWLIPQAQRPKVYVPHPVMMPDEIRARTQAVWDRFYSLRRIWVRSRCTPTLRARLAFVLIS